MQTLVLDNGLLHVEILPELGGGIARFDWVSGAATLPVFRPRNTDADPSEPNTLACYPLVPWSNRIGHGRFDFGGATFNAPQTRPDEPYPIHGHGWLSEWEVLAAETGSIELYLQHNATDPFCYEAWLRYQLSGNRLSVTLSVRNLGQPLPFGLGLHPFLPRTDDVQLQAPAATLWQAGPDCLPTQLTTPTAAWNFDEAHSLDAEINHAFGGWPGRAEIRWPAQGLQLNINADPGYYVLFTPTRQDFFCFEPVDHPVNAHNLPGGAATNGLTVLATGQTLSRRFHFTVHQTLFSASASSRQRGEDSTQEPECTEVHEDSEYCPTRDHGCAAMLKTAAQEQA